MDQDRADKVLAYALAIAGQEDERQDRLLGRIHLLKYAYIADLAYAQKHSGETFTGANWQFYHFGPWALDVFTRIEPMTLAVGAETVEWPSQRSGKDAKFWRVRDPALVEKLESELPDVVCRSVKKAVRRFLRATPDLLHFVYQTPPMLRAAPGQRLSFEPRAPEVSFENIETKEAPQEQVPLSTKQEKRRKEKIAAFKQQLQESFAAPPVSRRKTAPAEPAPRYDEVFFEGQSWLDEVEGKPLAPTTGKILVDESVWTSPTRSDPEIP